MKFQLFALAMACSGTSAFVTPAAHKSFGVASSSSSLNMVLEAPREEKAKKLSKLEVLKTNSDHLIHPLKEVSLHLLY